MNNNKIKLLLLFLIIISGYFYNVHADRAAGQGPISGGVGCETAYGSIVTMISYPTTMAAGSSADVSMITKNCGLTPWSGATGFRLGSPVYGDFEPGRVYWEYTTDPGSTVYHNGSIGWNFSIYAPSTPGTYHFQLRMLRENVKWFGEYTPDIQIVVTALPPTVSISASPTSISYNSSSTITWFSANTSSCSVSPPGWTGVSGSQSTGALTATTTYTVSCSGSGGSVSDSVTVTVGAPPAPACSSAGPDGDVIDSTTTGHTSYAYGASNTTSTLFAVWSEVNGQDDLIWWPGTDQGSGTWAASVNMTSHPGIGAIYVYAYLYNSGIQAFCDTANLTRVKTGTVKVRIDAGRTWTLTGPYGYSSTGTGNADRTNLKYGVYTLTPQTVSGYNVTVLPSSLIELKD